MVLLPQPSHLTSHQTIFIFPCELYATCIIPQVYEASMARLHNLGATPAELAVVSRVCPDQSTFVKALTGMGRAQAFWLEFHRKRLRKV